MQTNKDLRDIFAVLLGFKKETQMTIKIIRGDCLEVMRGNGDLQSRREAALGVEDQPLFAGVNNG